MNTTLRTRLAALLTATTLSLLTVTGLARYALPEQPAAALQLAAASAATTVR